MSTTLFDPADTATRTLRAHTDPQGRHRLMLYQGRYTTPTADGEWQPLTADQVRVMLAEQITSNGDEANVHRLNAAEAHLRNLLGSADDDQLPRVDPAAICTPATMGGPPRNWPTEPGRGDDARGWIGAHSYGPGGRWLLQFYGSLYRWDRTGRVWQLYTEGTDEWLADLFTQWAGHHPGPAVLDEIRAALTWPGDRLPESPGEVADADLARALAQITDRQTLMHQNRRKLLTFDARSANPATL